MAAKRITVNGEKLDVYDTIWGVGVRFKGVHYTAGSVSALEHKVKAAARSNAHGFKSNRTGTQSFLDGLFR